MTEQNKTIERVAALCHIQWASWMRYLFTKCEKHASGEVIIPKWAVERWERQMGQDYKELTDTEKESDRREAKKFIKLILQMAEKELLE